MCPKEQSYSILLIALRSEPSIHSDIEQPASFSCNHELREKKDVLLSHVLKLLKLSDKGRH